MPYRIKRTSNRLSLREKLAFGFVIKANMLVRDGCVRVSRGGIVLRRAIKTQFCVVVFGVWAGVFGVISGDARAEAKISVAASGELRIRIKSLPAGNEWSFRNAYAGVLGIAERVDEFHAFGSTGEDLSAKKITTGIFRSQLGATSITYVVKLPPPTAADVSHVSWLVGDSGLLMLADLMPESLPGVMLEFSLPSEWTCLTAAPMDYQQRYYAKQPEKAVFLIGRSLRMQAELGKASLLRCFIGGDWPFKDDVILSAAMKVMQAYTALTHFAPLEPPVVMLVPLPVATGSVKWRAETRGSTTVLLMDPQADIKNWKGQLGIIFTHELLHLWVPNSLRLEGDYDWFFEGFTLYTALVTALDLKFIDFDEYLRTLARVYDSYLSRPDDLSLIDASERRWTSGNSVVYDKGMLVAFLYDLLITRESGGRSRLANLYRELFREAPEPANGNDAIISLLSSSPAAADLAKTYIQSSKELELEPALASYGLRLDTTGKSSTFRLNNELRPDQKQLLKSLGYR